jgi:[acyl-carrier-protein] S-malonyltransferase
VVKFFCFKFFIRGLEDYQMKLKNTAFVFPGQGSQYAGMGKEFCELSEIAANVLHTADKTLGFPLSKMCFFGPEEELKLTFNTQPALLAVSIAIFEALKNENIEPVACAGHSLGEYSALVAAGVIPFTKALRLVRNRGTYMQEAVPVGVGKMAAVMGLNKEEIEKVLEKVKEKDQVLSIANLNCPGQIVIAGNANAVKNSVTPLKEQGAKRVIELPVSAPFHCSLMKPAADKLSPEIDNVNFNTPMFDFYSNVTADKVEDQEQIKEKLKEQITHPVLWQTLIENMINNGIDTFVEIGAGKVLSGLIRKIDKSVTVMNVSDKLSLEKFLIFAKDNKEE